jgi:hypothetical protein
MPLTLASPCSIAFVLVTAFFASRGSAGAESSDAYLPPVRETPAGPVVHRAQPDDGGTITWWLPGQPDELVLPITSGVNIDMSRPDLKRWLREGSPWSLNELPVLGARYGDSLLVVIAPSPLYAEFVVSDRMGVRFSYPPERTPERGCEIITIKRPWNLMATADAFRDWRSGAKEIGAIPAPLTFGEKSRLNPKTERLLGAPHLYLWGPARFSKHDVRRGKWKEFAVALRDAPAGSTLGHLVARFTSEERKAVEELATAEWPADYLRTQVAVAVDGALGAVKEVGDPTATPKEQRTLQDGAALAQALPGLLNDIETWGDGPSLTILNELRAADLDRAVLVLSDLYKDSMRADISKRADELGYLLGPYDSYHSVHAPDAPREETWPTAQFDRDAYEAGRVLNADGSGHRGFKGQGFHFAPQFAWPFMSDRVNAVVRQVPYSAYFIDCDATSESFDDYSPNHPASRYDDVRLRRKRLAWLNESHQLVVGSEGGSILFADVIHFGHGVQTPYLGHLDAALKDKQSPFFLGRYWPQDQPELFFKPTPLAPSLRVPYFDPTIRVPLYRAALGEEVIASHHWTFDSLKFPEVQSERELLDVLYMVPPMYHLNRQTWPKRRDRIVSFLSFWSPLHRVLGTSPMTSFEYLSGDRLLQRVTYKTPKGPARITVNFSHEQIDGYPALSATVDGEIEVANRVYVSNPPSDSK